MLLQVGLDEVYQLRPETLKILEKWLGNRVTFTQRRPGESGPNIIGRVAQHTVLLMNLYSDRGVNARAAMLVRSSQLCHFCCALCLTQMTAFAQLP